MSRRTALAAGIVIFAATLFLTPGCFKNTTTAPCDGFNGGNIVGKWRFRFFVPDAEIKECRADGTYRQEYKGTDPRQGTYEVDGNLVRTQYRTGNATARGERCFDVRIMAANLWVYARRRFGKNIGIEFNPSTGLVVRTEGIWGK